MDNVTYFFAFYKDSFEKVDYSEIHYVSCAKNYVHVVCNKRCIVLHITLKEILGWLPSVNFCQVHRSYVVNMEHVDRFDYHQLFIGRVSLPIGRLYKPNLSMYILPNDNSYSSRKAKTKSIVDTTEKVSA